MGVETRPDQRGERRQCPCAERNWGRGERAGRGELWLRSGALGAVAAVLALAVLAGCDTGSQGTPGRGEGDAVPRKDAVQVGEAGARVALVIGNAAYEFAAVGRLNNPVRDAEAVAAALRKVGFKVTVKKDLQKSTFLEALNSFREASRRAEAAAFYYAGHGMAKDGLNYMIPVDMKNETKTDDAINLKKVTGAMGSTYNLVFLDACRTPPKLQRGPGDDPSPLSRGLVAVSDAAETGDKETRERHFLYSYAAEPGKAASDGELGENSPYAAALAEHIGKPGQQLEDLLRNVESAVSTATQGKQRTWHSGNVGPPFYFVKRVDTGGGTDAWQKDFDVVRKSRSASDLEGYILKYKNVPAAKEAVALVEVKLAELRDAWRKDFDVVRGTRSLAVVDEYIRNYENVPAAKLAVMEARELRTKLTKPVVNKFGMEFVWIPAPAGTFMMGSPEGEAGRHVDERQREERIRQGYWMGKYEVTQEEWEEVMKSNPSRFNECGSRCPVENVSWKDAQEFVRELNKGESERGYLYRLPSEAEWEYAARAGTSGATPEGELRILGKRNAPELDRQAWYGGNSGVTYDDASDCSEWEERQYEEAERCGTHPVGMKRANGWGLHDMLGNVWEWTADLYREDGKTQFYVARGGGWHDEAKYVRSARRGHLEAGLSRSDFGFRLVREK